MLKVINIPYLTDQRRPIFPTITDSFLSKTPLKSAALPGNFPLQAPSERHSQIQHILS
jgi:hypothetical protein